MGTVTRFRLAHNDPGYPNPIPGKIEQFDSTPAPTPSPLSTTAPPMAASVATAGATAPATTSVTLYLNGWTTPIGSYNASGAPIRDVDVTVTDVDAEQQVAHGSIALNGAWRPF